LWQEKPYQNNSYPHYFRAELVLFLLAATCSSSLVLPVVVLTVLVSEVRIPSQIVS
jgi:hypothetical protein